MKVISANELRIGDIFWYMDQAFSIDRIRPISDDAFFFDVSTHGLGQLNAIFLRRGFFSDKTKLINLIYRDEYEKEDM